VFQNQIHKNIWKEETGCSTRWPRGSFAASCLI